MLKLFQFAVHLAALCWIIFFVCILFGSESYTSYFKYYFKKSVAVLITAGTTATRSLNNVNILLNDPRKYPPGLYRD
jgi:hypothetical protein